MLKFISFGSGSSGNCYYLNAEGYGFIIDLGIGLRTLKRHFRDFGLKLAQINGILVTHDHTDHVKGVGALSTEFHLPVYTSQEVHDGMARNHFMSKKVQADEIRVLPPHETFELGPFRITPFPVPHDSAGNNGFFIEYGDLTFCLATDVGHITPEIGSYLQRAKYLVIEANYDATMLEKGRYPVYLRKRIMSPNGHLCNDETGIALAQYLDGTTRRIWLCHLSEENNHPELARKTIESLLEEAGKPVGENLQLDILRRKVPTGLFELE